MRFKSSVLVMGILFITTMFIAEARNLKIEPFAKKRNVHVVLNLEDNHFSIQGGCNTMNGQVEIDKEGIFRADTARMASTLMACPDELQNIDARIDKFLENSPKVIRKDSRLFLVGTIEGEEQSVYLPIDLDKGTYADIEAMPYETVFYYISPEQAICKLSHDGRISEKRCLQIRKDKDDPWEILKGRIRGFKPEPNVEYRLRLKEYSNEDGSKSLVLDMIVEQAIIKQELKN